MKTNVLNDLSNVVKKGTILAGSAAAAVDSCAAGSTTLAEYPGNHPVITQLSPRNHPLLDAIWKHVAMIFAVLVMSIGQMWADTYTDTYTNPKSGPLGEGKGYFTWITLGDGFAFNNSSVNISSNGGTGTFTISTIDGSYIDSINFALNSDHPASAFSSTDGTVTKKSETEYGFKPSTTTKTSVTFSVTGASGKKPRIAPIRVFIKNREYFTKNFSVSSGTVSCVKSNASTDIVMTTTGSVSSNNLQLNNKSLTITSSGHNIKKIYFVGQNQGSISLSANTGTYSSNAWTAGADVNTVTFTSSSNVYIAAISVELESSSSETWVVAGQWDSYSTSTNTLTGSGTLSTTISLAANKRYEFKIVETVGDKWYGNSGAIIGDMTNWTMSTDKNNCRLHTGPAGDYTFTFDPSTKNLSVTYPSVTHPSDYYVYFKNSDVWGTVYGFMTGGSGDFAGWPGTVTNTTTICGETYHYGALLNNDGTYNKIIFNNGGSGYGNQTSDLSISGAGKYNANRDANWHDFTTYTISFANGGGTGTMSAIEGICPNSNQAITANAFEKTGHTFNCWHADKAVKVGGNTIAIGGDIAGGATLQEINNNITLTAQWTAVKVSSITVAPSSKTLEVGGTQQLAATVSPDNALDKTVTWSTSNGSVATVSSTGLVTAVAEGTCTITATANDGSGKSASCSITVEAAAAGNEVAATWPMISGSSLTLVGSADHASVTPSNAVKAGTNISNLTDVVDASFTDYTGKMAKVTASGTIGESNAVTNDHYLKYTLTVASGYKFTPTGFSATVARFGTDNAYAQVVLKQGATTIKATDASKPSRSGKSTAKTVYSAEFDDASTYSAGTSIDLYIYLGGGMASGKYYGVLAVSITGTYESAACATPDAPTAFSAGSITSTGATFSITDAANAASYDIYYSTSNTAPTASTPATTTSTSKTKAVTGLTASTTYYAWVRSVCDASHKSAWVALSGSSFTTEDAAALNDGCWDPANTAADKLISGDVTLTAFDNNFSGVTGITSVTLSKGTGDGKCSGADETPTSSGYLKVKNASSSGVKIITIVTSTAKDITIGGEPYGSNTGSFYLVKSTAETTKLAECNTGATSKATNCPAGTYYVYAKGNSSKSINFSLLCIEDAAPDETAPTFVSSVPANGATDVATSGTIVLTFSEALGTVDVSKFTLTGATKGTVTIDGSDATKVNITYSGAENSSTVTLATAAAAVSDVAGNALAADLSNISFTTAAAAPAGDCEELFAGRATSTSVFTPSVGSATFNLSTGNSFSEGGYSYSVKPNSSNAIVASPKDGSSFAAGDSLIVVIYNNESGSKTMGFRLGSGTYSTSVGSKKLHIFRQVLVASDISAGKVTFTRQSSDDRWVEIIIKHCGLLPSCTTPVIPTLSNQSLCAGTDIAVWNATVTNAAAIEAAGETVAYSWKKKGNDTELANTATFDLGSSATESQAGTYVVTVTVSKAGKASSSAYREVELSVTEETEVTNITADKATVYAGNSVTLTATANTSVTWQWYTCTSAEGAGEAIISGAASASYTITSAPAAGTHYYKVKVTSSCGTAERVYTLTVTAASECENYFWFIDATDATANGVVNNRDGFFSNTTTGTSNAGTYKITIDEVDYTATKRLGAGAYKPKFTVPESKTATLYVYGKANSADAGKHLVIKRTLDETVMEVTDNNTDAAYSLANIPAGEWTLSCGSNNWRYSVIAVKLCGASSCTDATPTITAANTTVCVGSELSISSTGYETGATFQWQKLNSSTSTWDNISGATSATYTVATAAAEHAGSYRLVATKGCARTSNTVTISVPAVPVFGSLGGARSVMTTSSLSITDVEASDATSYIWYKSANNTYEPGTDEQVGTSKDLIIGAVSEAANSTFYLFCVASNSCGSTTSGAITVNVTAYVEEDCATRGKEGDAAFGFEYSASQATYNSTACWSMNDNSKKLIYAAPEGKYFKTMKVTIASSSASKASYNWSTNGGTTFTEVAINSINTTLTEKTFDLSAHGNVNALQIGRNLDGKGESSGTLYVSKICFEYTDACTATTVTPSTSSVNYEMGGAWSNPTFTLSVAGTLTYSSSNEDIASVDDDGTVTFNGEAGTVTITASYAGGTISATEYCASSGSYTINVSCPGGAPKVEADGSTDMVGCNTSVTLHAKKQDGAAFEDGTYQWFRNGEEIDGATSASYTAVQAGTYTVARTNGTGCTSPSTNSAIVTSETTEPEVERLVPFQYYHVDKTYSDQMKMRHLFAVKNSGTLDGKHFKMYVSRNGGAATDVTSSNALVVWPNGDGHVDTVMVDLNKLSGKYSENDEVVYTCKAIDCSGNVSDVYKNTITMNVIGTTPTLALICSGTSKAEGTRKTDSLTVGGDFLTGYNVADLCQQTGNTKFDANTEWPLYTYLKTRYNITPVNGYADFYKYNYEPFDILLLTDFPKTKLYGSPKNDYQKKQNTLARKALDDMADLCDFRPLLSFKTHMVQEETDLGHVSKWQAKGFTSNAVVPKTCQLRADIVCYAHPMFASLSTASSEINENKDNGAQKVFTLLSGEGYESGKVDKKEPKKGIQGFEVAAADNFVIIAYSHFDATATDLTGADAGKVHWEDNGKDRNLVAMCERQANIEARMILFSLNAGAHSKLTNAGMAVVDSCLQYLLDSDPLHVSDCSLVFDNNEGNGDGNWNTATNWLPKREEIPHANLAAHIKAPCTVNIPNASALNIRIEDEGSLIIPQGAALMVVNTIKRQDGRELSPTEVGDIHIGSSASGNGTLIFNNNDGDTKARVDMYSNAPADIANMSAATSTWQYIGTPHTDVKNARSNYYGSWLYQYVGGTWDVIPNGGPLVPFRGYCITNETAPIVYDMEGTLAATTTQDIAIPAGYTVIANSWTAPIYISSLTDDDMEGITDKSIYFFNTGSDSEKTGTVSHNATGSTRWATGTYVAVPIHTAEYTGEDDHIPSMQGFYVWSTTEGTLHLDYDRHVRPSTDRSILSGRMHAPRRAKAAEEEEPAVLKIFARGSRYDDRLIVLEREDFTRGYDSGWDGEAWGGSDLSPMVYVTGEGREDAVSAIPEFEGTVIAFKAGEDDDYRFDFIYDGEESLYLFDTENNTYTQIMTGESYYFSTDDKVPHSRFILTRRGPQIATGVGEVPSDQVQGTKAKKLLIENKMYILLNGALYDATGKAVK